MARIKTLRSGEKCELGVQNALVFWPLSLVPTPFHTPAPLLPCPLPTPVGSRVSDPTEDVSGKRQT